MRKPLLNILALCVLGLGAGGCSSRSSTARKDMQAQARTSHAALPPGCSENLAGEYQHSDDPSFRYQATDDGQHVRLMVPATNSVIALQRTSLGLEGNTVGTPPNAARQDCKVEFPTRVLDCSPDALVLETLMLTAIDDACLANPQTGNARMGKHRLLRIRVSDAGVTPAGP